MTVSYSIASAAAATGLSYTHINRAIHTGQLSAKRSGVTEDGEPCGRYVIRAADLTAYIDGLADA